MYEMFHAGCGEQSKQLMLCEHGADIQYRICTATTGTCATAIHLYIGPYR